MLLPELVERVAGFDSLSPRDKICLFAWYLHTHGSVETFSYAEIRNCFREVSAREPSVAVYMPRMADKKPPDLVRSKGKYFLERRIRIDLDKRYGRHPTTVAVSNLLKDLPGKVPSTTERTFLEEAVKCYEVKAFRSAIVMTWNLAFDHLLHWILSDGQRSADFNEAIVKRFPKKILVVSKLDHFEELKESEIIEVCNTAALFSSNITKILKQKLDRRNISAHPSNVIVTQSQADDAITDLVNNVVLALT
jgi:hypothetical protein